MDSFSLAFKKFIERFRKSFAVSETEASIAKIHVDEVAAKIARFYDRVRHIVDYTDEHLLRKNTMARALKRRLILKEISENHKIAGPLVREIIRSGHLPNDSIPEQKISEVQKIIDNTVFLIKYVQTNKFIDAEYLARWLMQIAVVAIEETLDPPQADRLVSDLMFDLFRAQIVGVTNISEIERNTLIFISIQKALLRADYDQLSYRIIKYIYSNFEVMSENELISLAADLPGLKRSIDTYMKYDIYPNFYALADRYNTIFLLIRDIVFNEKKSPDQIIRR